MTSFLLNLGLEPELEFAEKKKRKEKKGNGLRGKESMESMLIRKVVRLQIKDDLLGTESGYAS